MQECSWESASQPEVDLEQPEQQWQYESEPVAGQFIVRFRDYKMAAEHKQALVADLGEADSWRYVDRNNAAAKFPTDFALLEIDLGKIETIKVVV